MATTRTAFFPVGTAAGMSPTTVVVDAGAVVKIGIFSATEGANLYGASFTVFEKTPGANNYKGRLDGNNKSTLLDGPGEYEVYRPALEGAGFGVYKEV